MSAARGTHGLLIPYCSKFERFGSTVGSDAVYGKATSGTIQAILGLTVDLTTILTVCTTSWWRLFPSGL